ncbi:DEP domain-containing protein DDB_G0279099 isoform X1 [Drosophila nasuta]|uniref:DEP domain-containing protein DDB_G0279099 isoform X1 n=2 Tax=Drosophila nasuta TaxID=42062 RepID=UPI00295ECE9C|nr:DEP domain-containing protein DDB_G0279099 isoform X1 [Drosophila nasuta]
MASNSSKKKSSGLRMLWIPGRKSHHPKGRYSSTNKHVSYSPSQKKSEVWTLGGSRAQTELIDLPSPTESNNGASTSSLATLGATAKMSSTLVKNVKCNNEHQQQHLEMIVTSTDSLAITECATLPTTPVAAISPNLNSPLSELAPSTASTQPMTSPIIVTTVEIPDLHHNVIPDDFPKVPSIGDPTDLSTSAVVLNSSAGTTASITTNSSSPLTNRKANSNSQVQINNNNNSSSNSQNASPHKGSRYRNHNNNQDDINSIESITSFSKSQVNTDFEWIDDMVQQRTCSELMHKNKRKKSKKHLESKVSDQLDGGPSKIKEKYDSNADDDEKVVKCLYYSLMCCDCTIS